MTHVSLKKSYKKCLFIERESGDRQRERGERGTRLQHYESLQIDGSVQVETGIRPFDAACHAGVFSYCDCETI